ARSEARMSPRSFRGRQALHPGRIAVRVAGEGEAGKAVIASGREEDERLPAAPPCRTDRIGGLDDHKSPALTLEEIPDRKPGLPRADDENLETLRWRGIDVSFDAVHAA